MQDIMFSYQSDDGTLPPDSPLSRLGELFREASAALGRPMDVAARYKPMMKAARLRNIVERRFKWPLNSWPRDPRYK